MTKKHISATENKAVAAIERASKQHETAIRKAGTSLTKQVSDQMRMLRDSGIYKTPEVFGKAKTAADKRLAESKAIHALMKKRCVTAGIISSSTLSDAMNKAGLKATKKGSASKGSASASKGSASASASHVVATRNKLASLVTSNSTVAGLSKDWGEFKDSGSNEYSLLMKAIYKAEGWGTYEG